MNKTPRFAVDSMLGKLAKWLRLLGYDTFYRNNIKPVSLLSNAQSEDRIIVSKRRYFLKHSFPVPVIYLQSNSVEDQLREVNSVCDLTTDKAFTRCIICNQKTTPIDKEYVKKIVPKYVFRTHDHFHQCIRCGKIYWKGSHLERAMSKIDEMLF